MIVRWSKRFWAGGSAPTVLLVGALFLTVLWMCGRPDQRIRRGMAALDKHDWERLRYVEAAFPPTQPYRAAKNLFHAALDLQRRDFIAAYRQLRLAAEDSALAAKAWLLSGEALYAQSRFREAEINFNHALKLDPNLVDAHRWLAIAYYDVGLMPEAVTHLKRVAELDPLDARPHRVMAVIQMDVGSYAPAIEALEESFRRNPNQRDREEMLSELAASQLSLQRYDDAKRTLAQCADTGEVLAMKAETLYVMGEKSAARRQAERALQSATEHRLALLVLGKIAIDQRQYDEAVQLLAHGVEVAPADYNMQYTLATALQAAGRKKDAEAQFAVANDLQRLREDYDDLLRDASEQPYNADIRYRLGVLAAKLGVPEMATAWLKAALMLSPDHRAAMAELQRQGSHYMPAAAMLRGG